MRQTHERAGRWAEILAGWWLRAKGYHILARRLRTPVGEIDLIARRGSVLALVEVKYRQDIVTAAHSLRPAQQARILRAAGWYLARRPDLATVSCRCDAVLLAPGRWPRHLMDAWRLEEKGERG